ncbi:MAG: hypothetical protein B6241_07755 [Spirochaetaceae bacterium 4572_59]|nr:MAG: hypothetical protein B6241_07755 [Spirochaetaceae bacterium 4572_59]
MAFTITEIEKGLVSLIDGEQTYMGIASGLNSKLFRSVDLGSLQNDSGWIIDSEGGMESWKISGVTEENNQMIFYGPEIKGRLFNPDKLTENDLWILAMVFHLLYEKDMASYGFFSKGWFLTEDNRILIFPQRLMDFIRKGQNEKLRQECWYPFNHPDRKGRDGLSFTLAVLSYRVLSGTPPYSRREDVELPDEMRSYPVIPIEYRCAGLKKEISKMISTALSPKETPPPLSDWRTVFKIWEKETAFNSVTEEEKAETETKLKEQTARRESNIRIRTYWRKKRTMIFSVVAIIACIGALISAPLKKALEPPMTMDMDPLQLVEAYYSCFDSMDQELMSDCIHKDAGKQDITEIMNFFVITKVRQGYEGDSGIISAKEWSASGRPLPEAGVSVFGLTDLEITKLDETHFHVDYDKWHPGIAEEEAVMTENVETLHPSGYRVRDTLLLEKQKKGNWLIVKLDRTVKEL